MKLCVLAVVLAFGCKSSKESTPAAGSAERPGVRDPIGFCARARLVLAARSKCFPEDTSIKMGIEDLAKLETEAPAEQDARRRVAARCAVTLEGMTRVEQPKNCPLDVTDSERDELAVFLKAWYGERTAAPATGTADADAAIAKLAEQRDAACACKDIACARAAGTELETQLAALPADTPKAGRAAAAKMLDEATRCRQRIASAL